MSASPFVVIGVPTFRRPKGLRRLIDSLANQIAEFPVHVLIADNEGEGGAGMKVAEEIRSAGFSFPLTAIAVPERGISQVRNALMEAAFGRLKADALAMVDDDQRVEPWWVAALVAKQRETAADVVGGHVQPEFEGPAPPWSQGTGIFCLGNPPDGASPGQIIYTCGVLISRGVHSRFAGERFDPAFSLSGGGDYEFFDRIRRMGATFAYASRAISYEVIGPTRATRLWAIQRAFRDGNCHARILRHHSAPPREWAVEAAKVPAALVVSTFTILTFFWSPARFMTGVLLFARQVGKIADLIGYRPDAYRLIHGS